MSIRRRISRLIVSAALLAAVTAIAQQIPPASAGPVPPALHAAKKIFISNAGADSGLFPHPFTGTPDRGYDQFYAGIQALSQFNLVTSPSEADLVLELQLIAPSGPKDADKQKGSSDPLPMFRLTIFDRKTHYVLWTLTESIDSANLQKTHDRNFDDALSALVSDFGKLTTRPADAKP